MSKYENVKSTITEIENILKNLEKKNMSTTEIEDYFFKHHKDIIENYPFLVMTLSNNENKSENKKMLDYMLENLRLMENGTKSSYEAELEVGQKIVDDYVKPNLKE
jgi:tRNA/tmRNA/rRNA uracil-C5-methylase (TrmA/RlmC/RlmD family)